MNELAKIAEESGLPTTQSELLLGIFQEFLGVTHKWEEKAKKIKVTNESQTDMMLLAREGRKEMQQLRLKLDRAHQEQKKIPLLYGRAVDGMKNVLRLPIVQLEEYLKEQEDFVVNKAKTEALAKRVKADKLLAEQELAEEKALQEKIEKDLLAKKKELADAKEKERLAQIERDKEVAKRQKIEEEQRLEREKHQKETADKQRLAFENEERLRVEHERELAAEQEKRDAENKELEERAEARRKIGQNRLNLLYQVNTRWDFEELASMSNIEWTKLLLEKTNSYKAAQEKALLEKQRADKEEKRLAEERMESERKLNEQMKKNEIEQDQILKDRKEKDSLVKCPKCSHVFKPEPKLL